MSIKPTILLLITLALLGGCALKREVSLVGHNQAYRGMIRYDSGYSGILTIKQGPGGESFSGIYSVVDHTPVARSAGQIIVPQMGQIPAFGQTGASATGHVEATGYWHGVGSQGSTLNGEIDVGSGGHGHGVCQHSNGTEYQIIF